MVSRLAELVSDNTIQELAGPSEPKQVNSLLYT